MLQFLVSFYKKHSSSNWFWITLVVITCCVVMLPLPLWGIPDGYDTPQHLRFVETYQQAIGSGTFVPAWASADNFGFGSIGIRFYPPIAHYVMALVHVVTNDWYETIWIACFFWMILGAIGMYCWAREYLPHAGSAIAAILFAVMPYHLMELYGYVLLAEFAAISVLPFCFLFATRVIKYGRPCDVLCFGASYSFLILTHLPSIITGSIGLGIYCLFLLDWGRFWKTFVNFAAAFGITIAATGYYLIRVVTEINWVKHNESQFFNQSIYDYRQYLFPMFMNPDERFWKKMVLLVDIPTFLTFVFLVPPILVLIFRAAGNRPAVGQKKLFLALSAVGIFLIFILSAPSGFVWDTVGILQKIQFPFRFLAVADVVAAMGLVAAIPALQNKYGKAKKVIGYVVFAVLFGTALFTMTQIVIPSDPLSREQLREKIESMQNEPGCRCWWPTWADSRAFNDAEPASAPDRTVSVKDWTKEARSIVVEAGVPSRLRVATFWYPYWRVYINGTPSDSGPDIFGAISIPLPPERSEVNIRFEEPFFIGVLKYVSLVTWIALFFSFATFMFRDKLWRFGKTDSREQIR